jgi:hypothetical protein
MCFLRCVIIIIITISFMQGIYTYIPETNNVPKQHNVTVILSLLFMVPISLVPALTLMYFYISTFRSIIIIIIIVSVGPAESRLAHRSLSRLIVPTPHLVPPFISRGARDLY